MAGASSTPQAAPFALFGGAHLLALSVIAVVALGLAFWTRGDRRRAKKLAPVLALLTLAAGVGFVAVEAALGTSWRLIAPLQLCDVAVFVAAAALLSRRQLLFELTYFWGCAGTALALLTPDIGESFPHHRFLLFFAQHGAIVVVAVWMSVGLGMRPERLAALRAWLCLNAYALVLGVFNAIAGTNFMYLCAKPGSATPLDWLGPWPYYLVGSELVALTLFALLTLPWRGRSPPKSSAP